MPVIEGTERTKWAVIDYDFAVDGGAVGNIPLRGAGVFGGAVPSGAVVTGGYMDVVTPLASGGAATAGVGVESGSDVVGAVVITNAAWVSAGRRSIIPNSTGANSLKTTASRGPVLAVGVAPLTAGKFRVYLHYV